MLSSVNIFIICAKYIAQIREFLMGIYEELSNNLQIFTQTFDYPRIMGNLRFARVDFYT